MEEKFIKFELVDYEKSLEISNNECNRMISKTHFSKLKKQCLEHLDILPPITVNMITKNIIDGQHRLKAFQSLVSEGRLDKTRKIKVMYVEIPKEKELSCIIDANINSKNWSLTDYIHSYIKEGRLPYILLDEWCKKHELVNKGNVQYGYGAVLLGSTGKDLQYGKFKLNDKILEKGDLVVKEFKTLLSILSDDGIRIETFARAWYLNRDFCEFYEWEDALKNNLNEFRELPKKKIQDCNEFFIKLYKKVYTD